MQWRHDRKSDIVYLRIRDDDGDEAADMCRTLIVAIHVALDQRL